VAGERPVVAVLAILADKDAVGIVAALAPNLSQAICTELPVADGSRTRDRRPSPLSRTSAAAAELARICAEAGVPAETEPDFAAAVEGARGLAHENGGVLLVAGSHYALTPARAALGLCED
jgi:folylpolyglutamate synthase/dihydropteroate synthase